MMKQTFSFKLLFFFLILSSGVIAQDKPFWNEIQAFKKLDSTAMPAKGGIVFTGSSSFRLWKDAESIFKNYQVINRGFGGSTLPDANEYLKELVLDYKPRQVVIYSGENDIAQGTSAEETYKRFVTLFTNLRSKLPKASIAYVSMKLSPSREKFSAALLQANASIKEYISKQKNAAFIDITSKMLDSNGNMRPELFQGDMLHMKPEGYAIWQKEITPYLKKK